MAQTVEVQPALNIKHSLFYKIPPHFEKTVTVGKKVSVPLRSKMATGYIINTNPTHTEDWDLKEITAVSSFPPFFGTEELEFYRWVAHYYHSTLGEVLRAALPRTFKDSDISSSGGNKRIFDPVNLVCLNPEQKQAVSEILPSIQKGEDQVFLLFGVTGSGKTEVYLHCIEESLRHGKRSLILVPEIALTPKLVEIFERRFGDQVGVLHSGLNAREVQHTWHAILSGTTHVLLGVRSAIFTPLKSLGLIVVDEEQETSYKQEGGLRYQARDMALVRAKLGKFPAILASATPSLSSYYHAKNAKYKMLKLTKRVAEFSLPEIHVVDLKTAEPFASPFLSKTLFEAVRKNVLNKQQTILFLNRKGFAPLLLCRKCGASPQCINCAITMTYYKKETRLRCHYCSYSTAPSDQCTRCGEGDQIPLGIGTEQIESLFRSLLPEAIVERLDKSVMTSGTRLKNFLARLHSKEIDIVVGTQIIAKGHDIPHISLVGILLADLTLNFPDFRALEQSVQLFTQVAGRAGRGKLPGKVIIQTYQPESSVFRAIEGLSSFEAFYEREMEQRMLSHFPPTWHLVNCKVEGSDGKVTAAIADRIGEALQKIGHQQPFSEAIEILGPAEAPIARLKGKARYQILVRSLNRSTLHHFLALAKKRVSPLERKGVQCYFDIDPYSLL